MPVTCSNPLRRGVEIPSSDIPMSYPFQVVGVISNTKVYWEAFVKTAASSVNLVQIR